AAGTPGNAQPGTAHRRGESCFSGRRGTVRELLRLSFVRGSGTQHQFQCRRRPASVPDGELRHVVILRACPAKAVA
ncbi:MAG: hypothetical protein ACK56F_00110, partial [bacterium]